MIKRFKTRRIEASAVEFNGNNFIAIVKLLGVDNIMDLGAEGSFHKPSILGVPLNIGNWVVLTDKKTIMILTSQEFFELFSEVEPDKEVKDSSKSEDEGSFKIIPHRVKAIQWKDTSESSCEIAKLLQDSVTFVAPKADRGETFLGCFVDRSFHVPLGSWIVLLPNGSIHICDSDEFNNTYYWSEKLGTNSTECKNPLCSSGSVGGPIPTRTGEEA